MTVGDRLVDSGADRLEQLSDRAAPDDGNGGVRAKVADELTEDAAFLRKLKPSAIAARVGGKSDEAAGQSGPQLGPRPRSRRRSGPNPLLVIGIAFAAGIVLAKVIDWRGHAHPRN